MVLLSAQGMDVTQIAKVAFTSPDWMRGRRAQLQRRRLRLPPPHVRPWSPTEVALPERPQIKKIAPSRPSDRQLARCPIRRAPR